jgi:hypothetical protein
VSDHDFLFALEMSDGSEFDRMLGDLTRAVLGHVGYAGSDIDELAGVLRAALADGAASGQRCHVRFQAHGGELQIAVACAGRPEWRTTRPLPAP